jgi:hypothetical protein
MRSARISIELARGCGDAQLPPVPPHTARHQRCKHHIAANEQAAWHFGGHQQAGLGFCVCACVRVCVCAWVQVLVIGE